MEHNEEEKSGLLAVLLLHGYYAVLLLLYTVGEAAELKGFEKRVQERGAVTEECG